MANWDEHIITVVGPMEDIARFAKEFGIVWVQSRWSRRNTGVFGSVR